MYLKHQLMLNKQKLSCKQTHAFQNKNYEKEL